jgi:hypothetical protein
VELERALKIAPSLTDAAFNLGTVYHMSGDILKAKRAFERTVAAEPTHALAYAGLATCHFKLLEDRAAERYLAQALALGPEVPDVRWTNFVALMHRGDLTSAWKEFEWRWRSRLAQGSDRSFALPRWDGTDLAGRGLLVWQEQGIGDEIMFASLLGDLALHNGRLIVLCNPRLKELFGRAFVHTRVVSDEQEVSELIQSGTIELQMTAGSLCQYLRPSLDRFPKGGGYLEASAAIAEDIAARILSSRDRRLRVGLSWRSGNPFEGCWRSIELGALAPILSNERCRFFNLQYGDVTEEVSRAGVAFEPLADTDFAHNLENLAALIANLDLVISVDNTTAHIAAALGKATWILLPTYPEWRWFGSDTACSWYPSARLFRQARPGDWGGVIREVQVKLETELGQGDGGREPITG